MEILEHVQEWALARERRDDVVHDDEHRPLPLLRVARRLGRPGKMEELRESRRHKLGIREVQVAQLVGELRRGLRIVRIDP